MKGGLPVHAKLNVARACWAPTGGDNGNEPTHLVAMVEFAGCYFHLEAEQVHETQERDGFGSLVQTVDESRQETIDNLLATEAIGLGKEPMTATINGKPYVVWMSPFEL